MKKKNIELLLEAFQTMAKRMKTPLSDEKVGKYLSDVFKKFPQMKRTKILENQLEELIREYILLEEINEIEKTPKKVIEEKVFIQQNVLQESVHFLRHPIQRFIAAIGVLGLGFLLAIPLMKNQTEIPQASMGDSFQKIKSTFKWEGPKMPSIEEALTPEQYSFVLEGEIPKVLDWPVILSTLEALPDDSFAQLGLSKKYSIILKNPQFLSLDQGVSGKGSFIVFDAIGKNDAGEEVLFKQQVPLVGGNE